MKNFSLPQALILIACIVAPIVAYKLLDSVVAGGITMTIGMVLNFVLGRGDPPSPPPGNPPSLTVIAGGAAGLIALLAIGSVSACSALKAFDEVNNPSDDQALSKCRAEGRASKQIYGDPDRAYKAYHDCTVDAGLR